MNTMTLFTGGTGALMILVAGTFMLPRHVHVERQATMDATPEAIIALASSNQGYQKFNPYLSSDPDLQITRFGPASGIGSGFNFNGREGRGKQVVAEITPESVRYNIDLGFKGQPVQMIKTTRTAKGLLVTWSMDADMGMNPIARVMGLFLEGKIGKTLEHGLSNLASAT